MSLLYRKYCEQYGDVVEDCITYVREYLLKRDYTPLSTDVYKDATRALFRLNDFLEKFVDANQKLIADH